MKIKCGVVLGMMAIMGLYLVFRLPELPEKMTFSKDQGVHLLESRELIITQKIPLIGPMITSKMYEGRGFFLGPQYYYLLAFLGIIFRWEPLLMTAFLMVIEMVIILIFGWWIKSKIGVTEGWMVMTGMTLSPYLIINSRFIWNPNMAMWLGLLMAIVGVELLRRDSKKGWFILGALLGLAFSLHIVMGILIIPVGILIIKKWRQFKYWWWVIPGGVIGNLPWFVFELRHNFYNIRTFFWVMNNAGNDGKLEAHYLVAPFLGIGLITIAWVVRKINSEKIRMLAAVIVLGVSWWGQYQIFKNVSLPLGQPKGWNYKNELLVVKTILKNGCPENFNIAQTIDGDTRAYSLRYLLAIRNCRPMGVEEYPRAKRLFLVATKDKPPEKETVWEVTSIGKINTKTAENLENGFLLYDLGF